MVENTVELCKISQKLMEQNDTDINQIIWKLIKN